LADGLEVVSSPRPECHRSLEHPFREGAIVTPDFLSLTLVVSSIVAALSVLFLGGWLIRNDRNREAAGLRAAVIKDLRWIQDLVVDFFAVTTPCPQLLTILTTRRTPVTANELVQMANADTHHLAVGWAALGIMWLGGLVRFTRDGVLATDVGREVCQRISNPPLSPAENKFRPLSIYDSLFVPVRVDTGASSHPERVTQVLQRRAPELIQLNRAAGMIGIGQLRAASRGMDSPRKSPNIPSTKNRFMKKRTIVMSDADHEELSYAIRAADKFSERRRQSSTAKNSPFQTLINIGRYSRRRDPIDPKMAQMIAPTGN
jgi:hypothetical protein